MSSSSKLGKDSGLKNVMQFLLQVSQFHYHYVPVYNFNDKVIKVHDSDLVPI